jgi:hypothetical protein
MPTLVLTTSASARLVLIAQIVTRLVLTASARKG